MILYFSATGNCKYIAEEIGKSSGEDCIPITECIRENRYQFCGEKILGVVTPTYFWRLPRIVAEYLEKLTFQDCGYVFFLTSYGTTPGMSGKMAGNILKKNKESFDAFFSVIMPDTWTPVFDLNDQKRVERWLSDGKRQLEHVTEEIQKRKKGNFIDRRVPSFIAVVPASFMYKTERKTKNLSADRNLCIGCGLCEKKCPVHAIQMEEGHPVWKASECEMCLGCLHRCPKFAIRYGNGKSLRHGQYKNPYTKV